MQPRPAYTLLELLLVLALLAILAALAIPTLQTVYADLRVKAGADKVRAAWSEARTRAVNEGRPYRFALVLDFGNFRVAPDSPEYWTGGEPPMPEDPGNPPLFLDDTLPKGIRFRTLDSLRMGIVDPDGESSLPPGGVDPAAWSGTIVFLPDGTVRTEQEVVAIGIQSPGTRPLVVRLRALTGVITIRPYQPEIDER